jgi:hypothetical protein
MLMCLCNENRILSVLRDSRKIHKMWRWSRKITSRMWNNLSELWKSKYQHHDGTLIYIPKEVMRWEKIYSDLNVIKSDVNLIISSDLFHQWRWYLDFSSMVQRSNVSYQWKSPDSHTKAQKGALIQVERKEKILPPMNCSFSICSGRPDCGTHIVWERVRFTVTHLSCIRNFATSNSFSSRVA